MALDESILYILPYLFQIHHYSKEEIIEQYDEEGNFNYPPVFLIITNFTFLSFALYRKPNSTLMEYTWWMMGKR